MFCMCTFMLQLYIITYKTISKIHLVTLKVRKNEYAFTITNKAGLLLNEQHYNPDNKKRGNLHI